MSRKNRPYYFIAGLLLLSISSFAQPGQPDSSSTVEKDDLVLSYLLNIESNKKNGVAESYNGAVKTIFLNKAQARSRMVSLMRVQSVFYSKEGSGEKITLLKESGKDSYKKNLSSSQWKQMNKKYEGATYELVDDSLQVLDYNCKKAIVHLKDGKKITAYYTTALSHNSFAKVEPAFAGIPGVVLKYEYENKDALFVYTATEVSFSLTSPEIYKIP